MDGHNRGNLEMFQVMAHQLRCSKKEGNYCIKSLTQIANDVKCPLYNNHTDHGIRMTRSGKESDKVPQVVNPRNPCKVKEKNKFNIGTWNIRMMKKDEKIEEVAE
jgi:hypothetical protein